MKASFFVRTNLDLDWYNALDVRERCRGFYRPDRCHHFFSQPLLLVWPARFFLLSFFPRPPGLIIVRIGWIARFSLFFLSLSALSPFLFHSDTERWPPHIFFLFGHLKERTVKRWNGENIALPWFLKNFGKTKDIIYPFYAAKNTFLYITLYYVYFQHA